MNKHVELVDRYLAGPEQLRKVLAGMTAEQLDATPIAGKWSTRQVVCHIADFEIVYADRMKRVVAEETPTFFGGDPDLFASRLAYNRRSVEDELELIESIRRHVTCILRSLTDEDFERIGNHSEDGPMTMETLLQRITDHIPHHIRFIEEKRQALQTV
ncbi:MAG: DUF664 domain-containing protein [Planctomycetota bacterium]|nr:MAG: DUF664 domain-containing protein [Planctomycetota bacterium]